jgi:hypothetical protein
MVRDGSILGIGSGLSFWIFQKLLSGGHDQIDSLAGTRPSQRGSLAVWFTRIAPRSVWQAAAALGVGMGLVFGVQAELSYGLGVGLLVSAIVVQVHVQLAGSISPFRFAKRIQWTWRNLLQPEHLRISLIVTGTLFLFFGVRFGLSTGLSNGLSNGVSYWLLFGLYQGIGQGHVEAKALRRSLRNGTLVSLVGTSLITGVHVINYGVSYVLSLVLSNGLSYGVSYGLHDVVSHEMSFAWPLLISGFILIWSLSGGFVVLRHAVIRWLLARSDCFPWKAEQFLNDATARILLLKVSGGYSFAHSQLLDYFAQLQTDSLDRSKQDNREK